MVLTLIKIVSKSTNFCADIYKEARVQTLVLTSIRDKLCIVFGKQLHMCTCAQDTTEQWTCTVRYVYVYATRHCNMYAALQYVVHHFTCAKLYYADDYTTKHVLYCIMSRSVLHGAYTVLYHVCLGYTTVHGTWAHWGKTIWSHSRYLVAR